MSKRLFSRTGGANQNDQWEARVQHLAHRFTYPPTPDIASSVKEQLNVEKSRHQSARLSRDQISRQLAWAATVVLLILAGLLAVPQVRAAVVEFLQIGAIRIFLAEPTATATVPPRQLATPSGQPPRPSATPIASLLDLAGATTLAEAEQQAGFTVRLPTYPQDLGTPDQVFLQNLGGPVVVLIWLDPNDPERVRLSLHQLGPNTFAEKGDPGAIQETTVHGQPALWTEGPYLLQFRRGSQVDYDMRRLVTGHVLIWAENEITYRLETDLPLEEAVQVAESLQ